MKKQNIIKEIIIVLLLILSIILILGIVLYEYIPNNKIIPQQVSYTTPENVKSRIIYKWKCWWFTSDYDLWSKMQLTWQITKKQKTSIRQEKSIWSN